MKGTDIFCASQAATAICLSMDEGSSSSSSSIRPGGGRAIDRYNPIIRDPRRFGKTLPHVSSGSSPQQPISPPKPLLHHHDHQNKNAAILKTSSKATNEKPSGNKKSKNKINRKSSINVNPSSDETRKSWSCSSKAAGDFISPPGSSRYLLSEHQAAFFDVISDFDPVVKLLPPVEPASKSNKALQRDDESPRAFKPFSSSRSPDQVVVLRVSLHCRGCERKMRKHISRMEGVSSFDIDFAAKKVTVVGNVTPLGVLASISKVKNAQLWTPTAVSSASQTNSSEINKNNEAAVMW